MNILLTLICVILILVLLRQIKEFFLRKFLHNCVTDEELKKLENAAREDLASNNNIVTRRNYDMVAEESMHRCLNNNCADYWLTVHQDE